jgi:hypothetical protein
LSGAVKEEGVLPAATGGGTVVDWLGIETGQLGLDRGRV